MKYLSFMNNLWKFGNKNPTQKKYYKVTESISNSIILFLSHKFHTNIFKKNSHEPNKKNVALFIIIIKKSKFKRKKEEKLLLL